jgi:hypothetical protein
MEIENESYNLAKAILEMEPETPLSSVIIQERADAIEALAFRYNQHLRKLRDHDMIAAINKCKDEDFDKSDARNIITNY